MGSACTTTVTDATALDFRFLEPIISSSSFFALIIFFCVSDNLNQRCYRITCYYCPQWIKRTLKMAVKGRATCKAEDMCFCKKKTFCCITLREVKHYGIKKKFDAWVENINGFEHSVVFPKEMNGSFWSPWQYFCYRTSQTTNLISWYTLLDIIVSFLQVVLFLL